VGSTLAIYQSSGSLCYQGVYYPFGGEKVYTNTWAQNYKFTGLERDAESGLDETLNRMYSSNLGRWLETDPVRGDTGNPQTQNRYPYVANNPANRTDPDGNCGCDPFFDPWCGYFGLGFGNFVSLGDKALGQLTAHTENGKIVMDNNVMGYTDGKTITLNSWVNWADPNNTAALLNSKPWTDPLLNAQKAYLGASSMTAAQFMDFTLIHELSHYNSTIGNPDNQKCAAQLWNDCVK
jgi:RHS repeat-associated protein